MTRLLLTFDAYLGSSWTASTAQRDADIAREKSGASSIRVSQHTRAALAALGERIIAAVPASERDRYYARRLTPDALLAALASGEIVFPAPKPAPDPAQLDALEAVHASPRSRGAHAKGRSTRMQGQRPLKTHAKKVATAKRMQKSRPRKVHATRSPSGRGKK